MKQNPKKGKVAATNLIALGNSNKPRFNNLSLASAVKKVKTDDLNPKTFITSIEQTIKTETASGSNSSETTLINFLNSIKTVLITSNKPIKTHLSQCLAIFVICKKYPSLFAKPAVLDCLLQILSYNGKESPNSISSNNNNINSNSSNLTSSFKPQASIPANASSLGKIKPFHIAICNVILFSLKDLVKWPIQLVKAYLEDSFGDRIWVDLPECYLFVQNIETAFPIPGIDPRSLFPMSAFSEQMVDVINHTNSSDGGSVIPTEQMDHSELRTCNALNKIMSGLTAMEEMLRPRFDHCKPSVDAMIAGYIKEILDRRFMADTQSRPIIRTFCTLAAIPDVRGAAVAKSDNWLSTGKLQTSTLNMLTIMANSCSQNVMHNTHDINFCVYFMLKFKYKLSKPPVQTLLLECVRKITETHSTNLRNLIEIYINNEIYGTPTVSNGTTINSTNIGNSTPIAYVPQNKSGPASVTFPAVFFRFPSESIKILGELLHEQMCILYHDIKPVKLFIRDICRWIKLAYINSNGVYTQFASNGVLPDSLELHDLAQNLLVDRSNNEALIARMTDPKFKQLYVENMINIVCELQMLSVIRPCVREAFRERVDQDKKDYEALKSHFNTLRQIRYFTCKWLKNIFRVVESHVSADQMTNYIKQVLFLNVTRNNDFTYIVDESYGIGDIWNNETEKMFLVRGLTEIPISDKLVQTLINLGFEKHLCFRPSEIVNMISELIIRASASACTEIIPMNVSKCETIINNMFACCSYDVVLNENDPNLQIVRTLAYKSSFWKVCQALVVMASHCTTTVGALLWNNFPTVKNLMQIIITNNFDELSNDKEAMEIERQFCENDSKKIIELESRLTETPVDDVIMLDAYNSKLVNLLLFNLPQGPIRQPPSHIVESLKSINIIMKIGDRLSQCRNPDFLFEIVREQDQNKISSRKWIIDLVKKTSEHNLDCLPLLVLTEFIYHDIYEKIINNLPVVSRNDTKDSSLKRLVHKLRTILCATETDKKALDKETLKNIVGALSNSFFNRLSDSSAFIRKVARECLYILMLPISYPIKLMESSLQFVDTLKSIMNLNILQDNSLICSVAEALRETLKFETDIDVLHSYIDLFALMSLGNHKEWLGNTVETLSILMLNRPIIADKLRTEDNETLSKGKTSNTLICDSLAEIFLAHINYTAYQAKVVPLEHRDEAVMVNLKDKQFPVVVKVIQSQLALVCWGVAKSKKCKKLIDFWFSKVSNKYQLTSFTNIESNAPVTDIIEDWLVNAAVHSGIVSVMTGILNHHVAVNRKISHSLTPALYFMPNDFIKSYLNYMNSIVKSENAILELWLSQCSSKIPAMLSTISRMFTKVKGVDCLFKTTLEDHLVPNNITVNQKPNLDPKIIVKSDIENSKESEIQQMEINDIDIDKDNVWSTVVQAYGSSDQHHQSSSSIRTITNCISKLLASKSLEIVKGIENLFKLLKDPKTHSETLKVLNKSDFKLMPLLKLTFRSFDQKSFDFGMQSFRYLFKSYPHIEKSTFWKVIYNLSLVQGLSVANLGDVEMIDEEEQQFNSGNIIINLPISQQLKSLAKSIMQGGIEDAAQIGPKIDQLTILGLGNNNNNNNNGGNSTDSLSHFDMLHKLLFSSHSLNQYSDYFMSDLLHQSNVFSLREILHSILNRKSITQINASRVLDFITACLCHPRLQYSVVLPVSNQYIWPQQNTEIDLSESELINLLSLVIVETEHLIEQNGPNAKCVNKSLIKRSELVDICSSSKSLLSERYRIINRFIESKSHNPTMEKFGFALYSRLPNLIMTGHQLLCVLSIEKSLTNHEFLPKTDNVDRYSIREIHRIGQRLLAGLVSPRNDLQDMAIQGCKALVTKHPKLCVQLLPYMCALSDGALDGTDSWNEFRKKRSPVLYSNLLHLLEIMVPPYSFVSSEPTVRDNMKIILFNCLRVLIRYRDEHKFFLGFVTRLVGFMEKSIPLERVEESDFIIEHATEITALSKIYPQFRNLIVYVQKNREICSNLLSNSSTGELDDNRASQLPLLKLDLLVNFRKKLRETLTGNGILLQIKDLDDVSRRDTNIIGLFLDDLRRLINHSMNDVRIAAVQVLARYLNAFPEQATRIIGDFILPNMLKSSSWYWSRPFANLTLKTLCQTGMLTPSVVPLCLTNHARLYVTGNNGRGNYRESIELLEIIIDNISLESFMESVGSYNGKPVLKKDSINAGPKRGFPDNDVDNHKAKRSRFK